MSGHSKWSTIKHRKGAKDAARSRVFTRVQRELVVAAKSGGSDPEANARLRLAIQKAKSVNMPNDTLIRAIKRGAGEIEGDSYEEITYEGYATAGVGVLVEVLTDNRNRTAADVRHIFSKHGGSMGAPGSVSYNFERCGQLIFPRAEFTEDQFMEFVLESGAEDLILDDEESYEVICVSDSYVTVCEYFNEKKIEPEESGVILRPKVKSMVAGGDVLKVLKILNALEELDDVQNVFSTFETSDEDMSAALEQL